ncbi:MAG TPA: DUF721 domain-containing protein [Pyrinomonadaceae bacterium]|nr:DUF721 domain-containing protein [Pyrinomonadaceae bacterium]
MEALFRALPALLEALPDNETVREAVVFAAWRKSAGEQLAEHTCPVEFAENRLAVAVPDRSWQKNLASLSGQMIFRINSVLGSAVVTYIEFVVDANKIQVATVDPSNYGDGNLLAQLTPELIHSASTITDEKLRKDFLAAAAGCLARKERIFRHR